MTTHVGIAGTGKMGSAIACNLLNRGYRVSVWNVDPAMMASVVDAGAVPFENLESLAESVDVMLAMLWDDAVAREVSLGRIVPAVREGRLFIESSTLSPPMYELLADAAARRGVDFLACPVIGSVEGARTGSLSLFPGGTAAAFEQGRELLGAIGASVTFTGSPAASGHLKLAGNCMLAVLADAIGELLGVLGRAGVARSLAVDTLVYMLERVGTKRQQLLEGDATARFSANALVKDLRLAVAGREALSVDAPLTDCASAEFQRVVEEGNIGDDDYIAVALALERRLNRRVEPNDDPRGAGYAPSRP